MNQKNEQGFALPLVTAILMILVFISFFLLSQMVRHRQSVSLMHERVVAQYAAESGIALMQQKLHQQSEKEPEALFYQWNDIQVTTKLVNKDQMIHLESQAVGKYGVKQTIRVKLDPQTLAIHEWLK